MSNLKEKVSDKAKTSIQKEVSDGVKKFGKDFADGLEKRGYDRADVLPVIKKGLKDGADNF